MSLERWANESIRGKAHALAVLDRFKAAVRSGDVRGTSEESAGDVAPVPLAFAEFVDIYVERYVRANGLASGDTIEYRLAPLNKIRRHRAAETGPQTTTAHRRSTRQVVGCS